MSSDLKFEIKRGVKPPRLNQSIYPFAELAIGDGFFIPTADHDIARKVHNAARRYRRHVPDFRISARTTSQDGVAGVMIYRIA